MKQEITVPNIGDFDKVDVIEVAVSVGDTVSKEDTLITLETDKAAMEIPSPHDGVVKEVKVSEGDKVAEGDLIVVVESSQADAPATEPEVAAKSKSEPAANEPEVKAESKSESISGSKSATTSSTKIIDILVPDTGSTEDVDVIEVNINAGDKIEEEDTLITLESDKASMDIPSTHSGIVKEVYVSVGDKINSGGKVISLEVKEAQSEEPAVVKTESKSESKSDSDSKPETKPAAASTSAKTATTVSKSTPADNSKLAETNSRVHAGPSTRRMARELGVDLSKLQGSGKKGRVLREDIKKYVKSIMQGNTPQASGGGTGLNLAEAPKVDFAKFGEIETKPLSRIKKLSAGHLHRNWVQIPHVTQFDDADITDLEAFRQENKQLATSLNIKLTPIVFLMKAAVATLKAYPQFNSSLSEDGSSLVLKKYFHIGVAVDTPNGLVVPVIRDVDSKGLFHIAKELGELSLKAREGKLTANEMQGSCFTISSLGGIGGTNFTPIINAPDVAILGVSKSSMQPVYKDGDFVPRLVLPFSLSYDHRVIDGAEAARFTTHFAAQLKDIRRLLL
jgi:pyruvate dehydrogenase E2 component (dihydrolipoamide acetyltransferase)